MHQKSQELSMMTAMFGGKEIMGREVMCHWPNVNKLLITTPSNRNQLSLHSTYA